MYIGGKSAHGSRVENHVPSQLPLAQKRYDSPVSSILPAMNPGFMPSPSFAHSGLGFDPVYLKWLHSAKKCPHFASGVSVTHNSANTRAQAHTHICTHSPVSLGHCDRDDTGGLAAAVA